MVPLNHVAEIVVPRFDIEQLTATVQLFHVLCFVSGV